MTAPDSPAVARVRQMAALSREATNDPGLSEEAAHLDMGADAAALEAVLAELDEARRQPRVWLEGDTVPPGVFVLDRDGEVNRPMSMSWPVVEDEDGAFVEVFVPDHAAAVAAERERRRRVATRCVHCDARIPDVSQVRCPECECPWDGD